MWGTNFRREQQSLQITVRDLDAEHAPTTTTDNASNQISMDWLLRLFRSDFFDAFMAVTYLYRYRESRGVHDYLCNELYKLSDADLEAFMPQVCNLLVHHARDSPGLERFIMDKCADSMHMALQVFYFLQAAVEDKARLPDKMVEARVRLLRTRCETAAVNGSRHGMLEAASGAAATLIATDSPNQASRRQIPANSLFPSSSAGQLTINHVQLQQQQLQRTTISEFGHEDQVDQVVRDVIHLALTPAVGQGQASELLSRNTLSNSETEPETRTENNPEPPVDPAVDGQISNAQDKQINPEIDYDPVTLLSMKQERYDYFNDSVSIAKQFVRISLSARQLPPEQRQAHLTQGLESINDILLRRMVAEPGVPIAEDAPVPDAHDVAKLGIEGALRSLHLPLTRADSHALRILRVHSDEVVILTSRTRTPYLVNIEVFPTTMLCSNKLLFCEQRVARPSEQKSCASAKKPPRPSDTSSNGSAVPRRQEEKENIKRRNKSVTFDLPARPTHTRRVSQMTPAERQRANIRKIIYGDSFSDQPAKFSAVEGLAELEDTESPAYRSRHAVILSVYGEFWSVKEERILSESPFKDLPGTKIMPFIVKGGDDLRQEQLAVQLISQFKKIFEEEHVDVYLRPFTVMSVSSEAGFVEVITDCVSVHTLKKRTPNFVSLLDYFEKAFGEIGSNSFRAAQRRFIRSMAAYSLVTYLLQIKDRHNGNIMIDARGHVIHIDFGFMLTNSPGAIKFENVPFKLTEEYLQVICAKKNVLDLVESSKTEGYRYFQEMFVLGLLAARKHYDKIITLVEIMTQGTTMPCMIGGHSVVESLRNRFPAGIPEEQGITFALALIEESRLSWRSAGYDRFQAYSNGYR